MIMMMTSMLNAMKRSQKIATAPMSWIQNYLCKRYDMHLYGGISTTVGSSRSAQIQSFDDFKRGIIEAMTSNDLRRSLKRDCPFPPRCPFGGRWSIFWPVASAWRERASRHNFSTVAPHSPHPTADSRQQTAAATMEGIQLLRLHRCFDVVILSNNQTIGSSSCRKNY